VGSWHALMMAGMSTVGDDLQHDGVSSVVTVSEAARATVLEVLSREADAASLALWIEVSGERNGAYAYDMYFQALADAAATDVVQHDDELPVVVPAASVDRMRGSTLDEVDEAGGEGGLVIVNPNTPPTPAYGAASPAVDLSDPLAQRVVAVLDEQVNPSIAAHGGRADLVAVDKGSVYLRLSGGCQGCGMAKATLSQGIEVILREAIPEIAEIVDVTDHADGTNPYYEPAGS
jgi:Fe/S biogenesis protein NfuA